MDVDYIFWLFMLFVVAILGLILCLVMMFCPCFLQHRFTSSDFCVYCGESIYLTCPSCGEKYRDLPDYCSSCGFFLEPLSKEE